MQLNSDFSQKVLIHDRDNPWQTSPAIGVERKMLDRIGNEIARATTIVRFAPQSSFEPHTHYGGEEYIVLDGVFRMNLEIFQLDLMSGTLQCHATLRVQN